MQKKGNNKFLAGVLFVVLTIVVVAVGVTVGHKRSEIRKAEGEGFVTASTKELTEALGKFDDFSPTASIQYNNPDADETDIAFGNTTTTTNTEANIQTEGTTSVRTTIPVTGTTKPDPTATIARTSTTAPALSTTIAPTSGVGTTVHNYGTGDDYAYAYAGFKPQPANTSVGIEMMLVNRNYILPQDYSPTLAEAAKGTGVRMDARVAPYYQKMYDAAKADGITLTPLSGHRRISTQKTNFENKIQKYMNQGYNKAEATRMAAKIILPPGTSEHNAGIAMDIISLDVEFEQTAAFRWLQKNAQDYGFILRYPKDKQNITEITYEPWHWRYVGVENAKKIKASGLCLEEYLGVR